MRWKWLLFGAVALALTGSLLWWKIGAEAGRRNDLWRVVHDVCMADQRLLDKPDPCVKLDVKAGYAVVPGFPHADELLLVPTVRRRGIEDPALQDSATPNYWALAWDSRGLMLGGAKAIPRDWIGLAINSAETRSQDQLHIHIDCLRADVRSTLAAASIPAGRWRTIEPLPGARYQARFLPETQMRATSPFRLLADSLGSEDRISQQTLVLIGAPDRSGVSGFYLLKQGYDPAKGAQGLGEELLDHHCRSLPDSKPVG